MTTIIIGVLGILQLISFFSIYVVNRKLAKFRGLENRQNQLLQEMDDSISLYLIEMRQENDRLIEELSNVKAMSAKVEEAQLQAMQQSKQEKVDENQLKRLEKARSFVPKNIAAKAYGQLKPEVVEGTEVEAVVPKTFEEQVITLRNQGYTVEEIAKQMNKGKTEIELLLKFHV